MLCEHTVSDCLLSPAVHSKYLKTVFPFFFLCEKRVVLLMSSGGVYVVHKCDPSTLLWYTHTVEMPLLTTQSTFWLCTQVPEGHENHDLAPSSKNCWKHYYYTWNLEKSNAFWNKTILQCPGINHSKIRLMILEVSIESIRNIWSTNIS